MIEEHPSPWLAPLLNGVEHANFFETRATEYSEGRHARQLERGVDAFDRRSAAKRVPAANEDATEGNLFGSIRRGGGVIRRRPAQPGRLPSATDAPSSSRSARSTTAIGNLGNLAAKRTLPPAAD